MSRGLRFDSASWPRPFASSAPGRKFSRKTSAVSISFFAASMPEGEARSSVTLFLLRLKEAKNPAPVLSR